MHELLSSGGQVGWWDVSDENPHDRANELTGIRGFLLNFLFSSDSADRGSEIGEREFEKDFLH